MKIDCPFCGGPAVRMNVTEVGVAFRCYGKHGVSGLRFDSMKVREADSLLVRASYDQFTSPYRRGSDRCTGAKKRWANRVGSPRVHHLRDRAASRMKVHYSGSICYDTSRSTTHVFGGYAACCSGDRAVKIKRDGNTTRDKKKVTCGSCKTILEKAVHCRVHSKSCCG